MGFTAIDGKLGLAMGSAPPELTPIGFHTVVLCAVEYQPPAKNFRDCRTILRVPLDDAVPTQDEIRVAVRAGKHVAAALVEGKSVLVTCMMGRNRSGLVTGLALIEMGIASDRAIGLIRDARGPKALSNSHFVRVLHAYARRVQSPHVHLSG